MINTRIVKQTVARMAMLAALSVAIAFAFNFLRPEPLAWVAGAPYEIFAECPETEKNAAPVAIADVLNARDEFLIVDSRREMEFEQAHASGAILVTYDSLFPITPEDVARVREAAGPRKVLVVGDGQSPRLLADELVSNGLRRIFYLEDPENRQRLGGVEVRP